MTDMRSATKTMSASCRKFADRAAGVVSGRFSVSPYAGRLFAAELSVLPLSKASEYRHVGDFEQISEVPILVSPGQRYALLDTVISDLFEEIPALDFALVQTGAPDYRTQLPKRLLQSDVLISHDPWLVLDCISDTRRKSTVVICQDLRADTIEPGANTLSLAVFDPQLVGGVSSFVRAHPLLGKMSDIAVEARGGR